MTILTTVFYILCVIFLFVSVIPAFFLWRKIQTPLARNFIWLNLSMTTFLLAILLVYVLINAFPERDLAIQTFFNSVFFLLYCSILLACSHFVSEMLQRKWEGWYRRTTEILALLGVIIPFLVNALVFEGEPRAIVLRSVLAWVYVPIFLLWLCFVFFLGAIGLRKITDKWKRKTLAGACLILFIGMPFCFVDAFWPLLQVEWKIIPRGWNFHSILFLAWSVYSGLQWFDFPLAVQELKVKGRLDLNLSQEKLSAFTAREKEVLLLILSGKSNQEIASRIGVSLGTAKNHVYNMFNKTGASSKDELCRMVLET